MTTIQNNLDDDKITVSIPITTEDRAIKETYDNIKQMIHNYERAVD